MPPKPKKQLTLSKNTRPDVKKTRGRPPKAKKESIKPDETISEPEILLSETISEIRTNNDTFSELIDALETDNDTISEIESKYELHNIPKSNVNDDKYFYEQIALIENYKLFSLDFYKNMLKICKSRSDSITDLINFIKTVIGYDYLHDYKNIIFKDDSDNEISYDDKLVNGYLNNVNFNLIEQTNEYIESNNEYIETIETIENLKDSETESKTEIKTDSQEIKITERKSKIPNTDKFKINEIFDKEIDPKKIDFKPLDLLSDTSYLSLADKYNGERFNNLSDVYENIVPELFSVCRLIISNKNVFYVLKNRPKSNNNFFNESYAKFTLLNSHHKKTLNYNVSYNIGEKVVNKNILSIACDFPIFTASNIINKPYDIYDNNRETDPYTINLFEGFKGRELNLSLQEIEIKLKLFITHIRTYICGDDPIAYKYLMTCISKPIRTPETPRSEVMILIKGNFGSGKSLLLDALNSAYGESNTVSITKGVGQICQKFNSFLRGKCIVGIQECAKYNRANLSDDDFGTLKSMIVDPLITLEGKGIDTSTNVSNILNIIALFNEDFPFPVPIGDRRFLILQTNDSISQNPDYFKILFDETKSREFSDLFYTYLKKWDDLANLYVPYMTKIKKEIINDTLPPPDSFIIEVLKGEIELVVAEDKSDNHIIKDNCYVVPISLFYSKFTDWCGDEGIRCVPSNKVLGIAVRKIIGRKNPDYLINIRCKTHCSEYKKMKCYKFPKCIKKEDPDSNDYRSDLDDEDTYDAEIESIRSEWSDFF